MCSLNCEDVYAILKGCLETRERLRPYIAKQMEAAHLYGTPVIRPLFYDFPGDDKAWQVEDEYMFGPDILVAPVLYEGMRQREVYLPEGKDWTDANTGKSYKSGTSVICETPLHIIPIFVEKGKKIKIS